MWSLICHTGPKSTVWPAPCASLLPGPLTTEYLPAPGPFHMLFPLVPTLPPLTHSSFRLMLKCPCSREIVPWPLLASLGSALHSSDQNCKQFIICVILYLMPVPSSPKAPSTLREGLHLSFTLSTPRALSNIWNLVGVQLNEMCPHHLTPSSSFPLQERQLRADPWLRAGQYIILKGQHIHFYFYVFFKVSLPTVTHLVTLGCLPFLSEKWR